MNSERFLETYRKIEEILAIQYADKRRFGSAVMEYINDTSNPYYREELNTCREIRNLLTHHAEVNGKAVVEPSDEVTAILDEILHYVSEPPLAIKAATKCDKLLTTSPEQSAYSVMYKMRGRGFSHVPVLKGDQFVGVFSTTTPFSYALENKVGITKGFKIGDFGKLLEMDNHCTERYLFAPNSLTVRKAGKLFETVGSNKKRLAMIFITENGKTNEQILGVLTPFDVLHVNEQE